jgi:hypothetical protein
MIEAAAFIPQMLDIQQELDWREHTDGSLR